MIEIIAYIILGSIQLLFIILMIYGMIKVLPYGIIGLLLITGFGLLLIKAIKDRLKSKEDNYYSKNIEK